MPRLPRQLGDEDTVSLRALIDHVFQYHRPIAVIARD
jgi:hypothetical protein